MFGLSIFEIMFLLAMALIVIGPKQLPEVARTLGKFLTDLRRSTNVIAEQMKSSINEEPIVPPQSQELAPVPYTSDRDSASIESPKKVESDNV